MSASNVTIIHPDDLPAFLAEISAREAARASQAMFEAITSPAHLTDTRTPSDVRAQFPRSS
jgi:hypothetical protein